MAIIANLFFMPSEVKAGREYIDGIEYYVHDEVGYEFVTVDGFVADNLPADGIVVIPETLEVNNIEYPVTQIRYQAFKDCAKLTNIKIPKTVTLIEDYAFERCYSLEEVIISDNSELTSIGNGVFKDCNKITSITLPKSLTSIGNHAFERCYSLEEVIISDNSELTSIGNGVFKDCNKITSITLPKSLTSIGEYAFERCYGLKNIIIPEDSLLNSIGLAAFLDCTALESISIPKKLTTIGNYAFERCYLLKTVTLPNDSLLNTIGEGAFRDCKELENLIIPKTVNSIGRTAFYNCRSVKLEYMGNFTNVSNNNEYYLTYSNGNFTIKLQESEGTRLIQENISIKAGGNKLDISSYSYNKEDGILTIPGNQITGNVEITAIAKKPYKLTINQVERATITPSISGEEVLEGQNIEIKIKANEGYLLKSVKVNDVEQKLPLDDDMISIKDIKEDINLVVEIEKEKIKVIFYANGGIFADGTTTNEYITTDFDYSYVQALNPTREGYKFVSWRDAENGGTPIGQIDPMPTGKTFYAQWEEISAEEEAPIPQPPAGEDNNITGNNPQTGDNILLDTLILLISFVGIIVVIKVKKYVKE